MVKNTTTTAIAIASTTTGNKKGTRRSPRCRSRIVQENLALCSIYDVSPTDILPSSQPDILHSLSITSTELRTCIAFSPTSGHWF